MPAVQLHLLKQQIKALIWKYTQPEEFAKHVHEIFECYANRVFRPGDTITQAYKGKKYYTPQIVLNQIIIDLHPLIRENPKRLLNIADILWEDDYIEIREIGINILGHIPYKENEEVVFRLKTWAESEQNKHVIDILLITGSQQIRKNDATLWLKQIKHWLSKEDTECQFLGLRAMLPLINDKSFENLPSIFNMITPYFQQENITIQNEILTILKNLINRSPSETIFFIRQTLSTGITKNNLRIVRKLIPLFDINNQEALRSSISNAVVVNP